MTRTPRLPPSIPQYPLQQIERIRGAPPPVNADALSSYAVRADTGLDLSPVSRDPSGIAAAAVVEISARPDIIGGHASKAFAAQILETLDDVRSALDRNPSSAEAAAARLLRLLTSAASAELRIARGGLAPWQKRKIDRYLHEHFKQHVHVDQLAGQVCLSVSHFCRAFKESFGASPHNYIIHLRLELAQKLMLTTDEPLSQIAVACGLADQAHLTKLFRRWVNESPGAWRRRNRNDAQAG